MLALWNSKSSFYELFFTRVVDEDIRHRLYRGLIRYLCLVLGLIEVSMCLEHGNWTSYRKLKSR